MLSIFRSSFSARIALYSSLCATVSIAIVCAAIAWRAGQSAEADALTLARVTAERAAGLVENDLHATYTVAQALSRSLAAQKQAGLPIGRAQLDATLKATVAQWPQWLGFYSVWAPNALDGRDAEFANANPGTDKTGRFLSWWNRLEGKITVSPVVFVEQAGANDWYDAPCKTKRDTWLDVAPFETGGRVILATTLSLPILVDDQCLGVVAVDLELGTLQQRLQAIPVPIPGALMALISQRGIYVSDPRAERLGKPADNQPKAALAQIEAGRPYQWSDDVGWVHIYTPVTMGPNLPAWSIEMRVPLAETHRTAQALVRWAEAAATAGQHPGVAGGRFDLPGRTAGQPRTRRTGPHRRRVQRLRRQVDRGVRRRVRSLRRSGRCRWPRRICNVHSRSSPGCPAAARAISTTSAR